jgi:hypothetical protein
MAQVERYVRLSVSGLLHEDDEYIVGLAFEPGERLQTLRQQLNEVIQEAVSLAVTEVHSVPGGFVTLAYPACLDSLIADAVHVAVDDRWPGRAHFIEVQHDSDDGWVQIFQPYDLPVRPELVPIPPPPPPSKPRPLFQDWVGVPVA